MTTYARNIGSGYNPNTSIFAGMSAPDLRAFLTQAQAALITLQLGQSVANVAYAQADGNKSVTFRKTDMAQLVGLIMQLQAQLGMGVRRRPLNPSYF